MCFRELKTKYLAQIPPGAAGTFSASHSSHFKTAKRLLLPGQLNILTKFACLRPCSVKTNMRV